MKEYISHEYLEDILVNCLRDSFGAEHYAYDRIMDELNDVPMSEIIVVEED